mgnify:CR=1 FL=1|jgi:hypothetical protein
MSIVELQDIAQSVTNSRLLLRCDALKAPNRKGEENRTVMFQYANTPYALIAVTSLLFTVPATLYLLWLRPKTAATYDLIGFLLCIIASLTAMFVFNSLLPAFLPLWPLQDAFVVLGALFLVRMAYSISQAQDSPKARRVTGFFALLAGLAFGWTGVDTWRFVSQPESFAVADEFWLLMPIVQHPDSRRLSAPDAGRKRHFYPFGC